MYFTYCKTFLLSCKGDPKDIDDVMAPLFFVAHEIMTSAALSPALVLVSVYFCFIKLFKIVATSYKSRRTHRVLW